MLICDKHHWVLHEGGHTLARENGEPVFRNHHGLVIPRSPQVTALAVDDLADTVYRAPSYASSSSMSGRSPTPRRASRIS